MDRLPATDMRDRVTNFIEEAGAVLRMLPGLFDENEEMRVKTESAHQEAARAAQELTAVKSELAQLRKEHDETARMCITAMNEVAGVINEMITKLRPGQKSSPFARDPGSAPADPAVRPASGTWSSA